jgi:hypothetical protein
MPGGRATSQGEAARKFAHKPKFKPFKTDFTDRLRVFMIEE